MIWSLLIVLFIIGYVAIALEHNLGVNKAASALFLAVALWFILLINAEAIVSLFNGTSFGEFLALNSDLLTLPKAEQSVRFLVEHSILEQVGEIAEILFFLIGAMTIVELIDRHGGFSFITNQINTRNNKKLLWIIAILTFFLSAVLDNLTTAIVMIMVIRKLIGDKETRWLFAGIIIIAANTGGAWSPIGDVTTIMLWIKGNISTTPTIASLFLPSFAAMALPTLYISGRLKGESTPPKVSADNKRFYDSISKRERLAILGIGVTGLMLVPILKAYTGMPPFMGILFALSVLWLFTEIMYEHKSNMEEHTKNRVTRVIQHIDMSTILFFLGILLAVAALQVAGILDYLAMVLDQTFHNNYIINTIIGLLSSVVDNVPLVAGAMGMYSTPTAAEIAASTDPTYLSSFLQDGTFWQLLTYCAGVGGSILIIGSAAGVVVMGLEKISFGWYLKRFSIIALIGYLAGIGVYYIQSLIF